jgi:hypothetical protein
MYEPTQNMRDGNTTTSAYMAGHFSQADQPYTCNYDSAKRMKEKVKPCPISKGHQTRQQPMRVPSLKTAHKLLQMQAVNAYTRHPHYPEVKLNMRVP